MWLQRCAFGVSGFLLLISSLHASDKRPKDSTTVVTELKVTPIYPAAAAHRSGEVVVKVKISETGDVKQATPISGDSIFIESALTAARGWKFVPFYKGGNAVSVLSQIRFTFSEQSSDKLEATNSATSTTQPVQILLTSDESTPTHCPKSVLVEKRMPEYPMKAKQRGVMGRVTAVLSVDESGKVTNVMPLSGPELLVPTTLESFKSWRYAPMICNGQPTRVENLVYATFTMGNQPQ